MSRARAFAGVCLAAGLADLVALNLWLAPEVLGASSGPAAPDSAETVAPRAPDPAPRPSATVVADSAPRPSNTAVVDSAPRPSNTAVVDSAPRPSSAKGADPAPPAGQPARGDLVVVFFGPDSAAIVMPSLRSIEDAAARVKADPSLGVTVDGFADATGEAGHNMALSEMRARAVESALVQLGVAQSRVAVRAHGASRALERGDTSPLAQDRCAEIRVGRGVR